MLLLLIELIARLIIENFGLVILIGEFIILVVLIYILIDLPNSQRALEQMRWQMNTYRNLKKAVDRNEIDPETADLIVNQPLNSGQYGATENGESDIPSSIENDELWEQRETALRGFRQVTCSSVGILFACAMLGGLALLSRAMYDSIQIIDQVSQLTLQNSLLIIVLILDIWILILLIRRIFRRSIQMRRFR